MYLLTALFGLTVASPVGQGGPELARDDGSVARSVALGLVFVAAGLVPWRTPLRAIGDREWPRAASLAEPMRRRSLSQCDKGGVVRPAWLSLRPRPFYAR